MCLLLCAYYFVESGLTLPTHYYPLVVGAFCLAAFAQGLTGFGYGLIAMALLPLLMEFREAVILVSVLGLSVNLFMLVSYRTDYHWRHGLSLILGAVIGTPCGVLIVEWVDAAILIRILGGLICVFSFNELALSRHRRWSIPAWCGFPLGCLSGFFGAAFNIGGPPAIIYVYSQSWTKQQIVALLQVLFLVIGGLRVGISIGSGLVEFRDFTLAGITLLPMFISIWCGRQLLERTPQGRLRTVVHVVLFAMGVKYLIQG